jgi:hypothetical protein
VLGKITKDGVYLEELEHNPAKYLPEVETSLGSEVVEIDLNQPMKDILATLSKNPIKTRLSLTGTMIVARDSRTPSCASGWRRASRCRITSRTIRSITRAPPRRRKATPPVRSARPPQDAWTRSSISSRRRAARW